VIEASPFTGEGYRKVWARLRLRGLRTAARRVRRIMKAHDLLAPHRPAPRAAHPHDGTIVTERVDETWGSDMTETVTIAEGRAYVFIAVDHCSGEFVGTHAATGASRWEALEPIRQGVAKHFGSSDAGAAAGLALRHDHGSNYMSKDFQREIRFLGIASSPAFVRQPEGNGVAERAIRTLKDPSRIASKRLGASSVSRQHRAHVASVDLLSSRQLLDYPADASPSIRCQWNARASAVTNALSTRGPGAAQGAPPGVITSLQTSAAPDWWKR